jgi:hypothetical protein
VSRRRDLAEFLAAVAETFGPEAARAAAALLGTTRPTPPPVSAAAPAP